MKKKFPIIALVFVVGIILAGAISYRAFVEAYRNKKIENEVAELKRQAAQIQNENDTISQKIEYYRTPQFQEKIAKEKLNLQKPDENVVIVKPSVEQKIQNDGSLEVAAIADVPERSNYAKWWNFFFKYN